jgi:hypothetical protein
MISTALLDHFAVLRDRSEAVATARTPLAPPLDVVTKLKRPDGPAAYFGLDTTKLLRVLALDDVSAWLIPGREGVCVITWDRRMSTCGAMSGPINAAVDGMFVNLMGSMRDGVKVYRAVGLVPDNVVDVTRSTATDCGAKIPIRNNVWTITDEPADGIVTLHWRTSDTQHVHVALRQPPNA